MHVLSKNFFVFIFFFSLAFSSYGIVLGQDNLSSEELILSFTFEEPTLISNQDQLGVSISDLPKTNEIGSPRLPVKPLKILLPYGTKLDSISVRPSEKVLLYENCNIEQGHPLFPVQIMTDTNVHFLYDNMLKQENPQQLYKIGSQQSFRGFPLVYVNVYPVQYDRFQRSLWYYPEIQLRVKVSHQTPSSLFLGTHEDVQLVASKIDNPEALNSYYPYLRLIDDPVDYVIITSEEFASADVDHSFSDLLQYRIDDGYSVKIAMVEEIIQDPSFFVNGTWGDNNPENPYYTTGVLSNLSRFNDTAAKIRNYIRNMHVTHGVSYVLLAGDADCNDPSENIVPVRGLFANESGLPLTSTSRILAEEEADLPSDVYYACLDGTFNDDMDEHFGESPDRNQRTGYEEADLEAEVYVGRAPIDSVSEMQNFVMKTLSYEQRTTNPYYSQLLFLGEYLGFPGVSAYGGNYKDQVLPYVSKNCNVRTLYDRDLPSPWSKHDLIEILEQDTPHLVNHDGHAYYGYNLKMVNNDVDDLTNELPFFVYSHGCMAGGFDNPDGYDCIAEHFTVETPYAAFAVIMNSRYGLGSEDNLDSPSQALDISFYKALFEEDIRTLGAASHFSKEDNSWQINENGIRWTYYETNLIGDPLLRLHLPNETPPNVNLTLSIDHPVPGGFYLNDNELFSLPFVDLSVLIGNATVTADAISDPEGYVFGVEFFLNDESIHYDVSSPYECQLPDGLRGKQELMVKVYGPNDETVSVNQTVYTLML